MEAVSIKTQMVRSNGDFCKSEVKKFIRELPDNQNITVVSIIGPQGTGKSYLLNRLFGTEFRVLDPNEEYGQTTEGIWIAQCSNNPSMVIVDVEGSDASNRAEDGTSFEYRAALLALTISDVLLVNMPVCALGQNYGGCLRLLRTIFQESVVSLSPGKTMVAVILRNCQNLNNLRVMDRAHEIIENSWESGTKNNRRLEDYIEVSVKQFPDAMHESRSQEFQMKLDELREQLTPVGIKPPQDSPLGAAMFFKNVQEIWAEIWTNGALNVPSFNEWLSIHRCETIVQAKLSSLHLNEKFSELGEMKGSTSPTLFKTKLDEFLISTSAEFDASAAGCSKSVQDEFNAKLKKEIVTKLESTVLKILMTKRKEVVEEKKVTISNYLRNTKKGVLSSIFTLTLNLEAFDSNDVDSIIDTHVNIFDDLFKDFCEEYNTYVSIYSTELKNALKDYAEQQKKTIEKNHRTFVSIGKGVLIAVAVGVTGYIIYFWGVKVLVAVLPSLLAMLKAASPKATSFFKYMVLNIIIPAAQDSVKEIMKTEKVTVKHVEKFMFNISMAMIVLVLKNISEKHSAGNAYNTVLAEQKLLLPYC